MPERAVPILPSRDLRETLAFYLRLASRTAARRPSNGITLVEVDPLTTDTSCYLRVRDADALHGEWDEIGVQRDPETGSRPEAREHVFDERAPAVAVRIRSTPDAMKQLA